MKPVIIIAIAFVLLIPVNVFAEYEINDICEWASRDDVGVEMGVLFKDEMMKVRQDAYDKLLRENFEDWEIEGDLVPYGDATNYWSQANKILDEAKVDKAIEIYNVNPELKPILLTMLLPETFEERLIQSWIVSNMLHPDFYGKNIECEQKYLDENWEVFSNLMYKVYGESKAEVMYAEIEKRVYGNLISYCEDEFQFGKYSQIEDYVLLSELASRGLTESNLDTSEILVEYEGNILYDSECQNFYKEWKEIRTESERWNDSCDFLGEFPNADKVREMYDFFPVCRFADLDQLAESEQTQESEIVCGTGTVEKNGICVPDYPDTEPSSKGGGCLIATATFGSELAPQVQQLRELRDNQLLNTESGTSFMNTFNDFYYSFSPIIADYERENPVFKEMVKIAITPMITSLSILNYVDMNSEAEVLGYGISLILLNVGMYVGIPAIVLMRIRR